MTSADATYPYAPDYIVPPGETLRETMESMSMTEKSLAQRLGLKTQSLHRIFTGTQPIRPDTAAKLEMIFGVPARFWNSLQAQYAEAIARQKEKARLESELQERKEWIRQFPVSIMKKRGYIPDSRDATIVYRGLLAFFAITSGDAWAEIWDTPEVAARRSICFETNKYHASVWIRQGERMAANIPCGQYNAGKFKAALVKIRDLTVESPDVFTSRMRDLCAEAGVALAMVPEIAKVPWNGATKWMLNKPLIILNLRGKSEDSFWFSFFHEAAHVLTDSRRRLYIADNSNAPEEVAADNFAAEFLIPAHFNQRIAAFKSKAEIIDFARELGIAAGIVAGRHRYLTRKWTHFGGLIRRFNWAWD